VTIGGVPAALAAGRQAVDLSLRIVADFTRALCNRGNFDDALRNLAGLARADAVLLECLAPDGATLIAAHSAEAHRLLTPRHRPGLAQAVLAKAGIVPHPGSVWLMSEMLSRHERDEIASGSDLSEAVLRDVVVIPLDAARGQMHVLELRFTTDLPDHNRVLLASLASMLSSIWTEHSPGARMRPKAPAQVAPAPSPGLLSDANPFSLSRAEYRVCLMVRDGLRAGGIAAALGISENTVRSHLRSIYAKVGIGSQVELLHALQSPPPRRRAG
jgi:DNA-binding CsgD family transcriptional regulator